MSACKFTVSDASDSAEDVAKTYLASVRVFDARDEELELTLGIERRHLGGGSAVGLSLEDV
jgi:hypothetical protein